MLQDLVSDVLCDMLNILFVYLDDILIFSQSEEVHVLHICWLLQHPPDVKAEKCELHQKTVSFLRLVISPDQTWRRLMWW